MRKRNRMNCGQGQRRRLGAGQGRGQAAGQCKKQGGGNGLLQRLRKRAGAALCGKKSGMQSKTQAKAPNTSTNSTANGEKQ